MPLFRRLQLLQNRTAATRRRRKTAPASAAAAEILERSQTVAALISSPRWRRSC